MNNLKILPLFFVLAIPFVMASADVSAKTMPLQDQILGQITSSLHVKPDLSFDLSKQQIVEYSLVGSIAIVIIIVIASSARSKTRIKK